MIVYGRNAVREVLRGPRAVGTVWATDHAAREPWLAGLQVSRVGVDEVERRSGSDAHQGIAAEAADYPYVEAAELVGRSEPLIVALDEVQDPQNLGSIARSAECAGATGLVLPRHRSAAVTPAVCRASAGAVEHLAIARVRNLVDFLAEAKGAGCWCYGTAGDADVDYRSPDYRGGVVCVFGSEGRGLRPRVAAGCDALIAMPLRGRIESLNVGAAVAVLLYGILQQRDALDGNP